MEVMLPAARNPTCLRTTLFRSYGSGQDCKVLVSIIGDPCSSALTKAWAFSEFARRLHQLHRLGDDAAIDSEFSAVCRALWGYTLDDFTMTCRRRITFGSMDSPRNAHSISPHSKATT